jgi:hypothetical protein
MVCYNAGQPGARTRSYNTRGLYGKTNNLNSLGIYARPTICNCQFNHVVTKNPQQNILATLTEKELSNADGKTKD